MLFGVINRHFARHAPVAHGSEDFKVRCESPCSDFKANLIVSLAGAAMSDRVGAVQTGRFYEMLHDDWPRECRDERILALVQRVGLERRRKKLVGELLATINDDCFDCSSSKRLRLESFPVAFLSKVARDGDYLDSVVLDHPANCD
ncbi:unannotated protein [freshwater metagenome]|uniref:Unannotated protein n=1 Tax=freshwater metagenome TaxID=449393 RepID=A0A6J6CV54_9ZZZZ